MEITQFTPVAATIGGVLIGIAAVTMMAFNGRIAGISGILGRLFPPYAGTDPLGAACFVLGLLAVAPALCRRDRSAVCAERLEQHQPDGGRRPARRLRHDARQWLHQRAWRVRDRAALAPLHRGDLHLHGDGVHHGVRHASFDRRLTMRNLVNAAAGLIFGLGLLISDMANPAKVQNFLDLFGSFDPSLIFVMGAAVLVTFVGYRLVLQEAKAAARRAVLPADAEGHRRAACARRVSVRHRLGALGFLPGACHRLAPAARQRHADVRPVHARRHRARPPHHAGEEAGDQRARRRASTNS